MEYIEIDGQEVEKYEYLLSDNQRAAGEQEPRCAIDVQSEGVWTGKTKALIVIMPHYDNDNPTIINVGLEYDEIEQAINIIDETYHDIETYRKEAIRLQQQVDRLEIQLDKAREESIYETF